MIGIGSSYLGAKAAIQMLVYLRKRRVKSFLLAQYVRSIYRLTDYLQAGLNQCHLQIRNDDGAGDRFQVLKTSEKKCGHEAKNRIYVTTDTKGEAEI